MNFPFDIKTYDGLVNNTELGPSGYYPIGVGNFWHSGVHINYKSGNRIIKPLITNGKVVLFRLNNEYEECDLPEKITQDMYNNEFSNYKAKYEEVDERGYKYYNLKEGTDNTYSVSNNFILLKHEIESEQLIKPLVFYTLYMNLAPITKKEQETRVLHTREKPFYPDCMLEGSTKEVKSGCVKIDLKDSEILTQIGKPGFLKGESYFDFCVFFEKPLFDNKEKKEANKKEMFHHFDKSITIYKKGEKRKAQSRKFYWPTETKADITAYTDDNEIIYEYRINKIRPIIETSIAKENIDYEIIGDTQIKILKTDNLFLSYKKITDTEFILKDIINKTFEKTNVNGKPAFYITSENFEEITIWTRNLIEEGVREVEVYEKNPLVYKYEEVTKDEEIYKHIIGIDSNKIETDNLEGKVVKLKTDINLKLYIKEEDKQKCMRSIYDWESWFFKLNELELNKSDIVCDRTLFTEIAIKAHNQAVENEELYEEKLEKWWYGTYLVDEYLKGIYGSNDKYEFAKSMRLQFMKATCKHPIEWDKRLFNCEKIEKDYREITNAVLNESIKNKLIKESEKSDIWEKGLSKVFKKNNFYFVNPLYFINHLENAGLFEFNPYEGKKYSEVFKTKTIPTISGNNITETGESIVINNPGFAPVYTTNGWGPNINGYTCITGFFNQDYLSTKSGDGYPYERRFNIFTHEGLDFRGAVGTEIKSFIYGTVLAYGTFNTYGRTVFIKNENSNGIFLLAHLSEFNKTILNSGHINPGDVVGKVGTSGNLSKNEQGMEIIDGCYDSHLHISYFNIDGSDETVNNFVKYDGENTYGKRIVKGATYKVGVLGNPFNYNSKRKENDPKTKEEIQKWDSTH